MTMNRKEFVEKYYLPKTEIGNEMKDLLLKFSEIQDNEDFVDKTENNINNSLK